MGIHPNLPFLKQLYDEGDALMVANMGGLIEVRACMPRVGVTEKRGSFLQNVIFSVSSNTHLPAIAANDERGVFEKEETET